jgi:hypothetical protein
MQMVSEIYMDFKMDPIQSFSFEISFHFEGYCQKISPFDQFSLGKTVARN